MIASTDEFVETFEDTLTEIRIDDLHFRVTPFRDPGNADACILWFWDPDNLKTFQPLGQFARYDKRTVLEFITVFSTSRNLQKTIQQRQFERRLDAMSPRFFEKMGRAPDSEREKCYRYLFGLDDIVDSEELKRRRRIMARKFHPDLGGRHEYMSLINEAYEHLSQLR